MAGNQKHGFMRGNANGRNGSNTPVSWLCFGCDKHHGGRVSRTLMAGHDYCDRSYIVAKERQFAAVRAAHQEQAPC